MATLGDKQQQKELGREVGAFNLSKKYEVKETAKSVLKAYPSRAEWTMNPWLPYFRKFMYLHTFSYIRTPLWTKCARAAAILSNISANVGETHIKSYWKEYSFWTKATRTRKLETRSESIYQV